MSSSTARNLSAGNASATTSLMPSCLAIVRAVVLLSPVIIKRVFDAERFELRNRCLGFPAAARL